MKGEISVIKTGIDRWAEGNINLMTKVDKIYTELIDDDTFHHTGLLTKVETLWKYNEINKETAKHTQEMYSSFQEIKTMLKWSKILIGFIGTSGAISVINVVMEILNKT